MKKIPLTKPIARGEEKITEIVLRDFDGAGDLRGIKLQAVHEMDVDTILVLVKRLSLTPLAPDELNRISAPDLLSITGAISDFFSASDTPSPTKH